MRTNNNFPIAYAAYNKNYDIRLKSTSGGIFTILAIFFIEEFNANVYGSAFDNNLNVGHIMVNKIEDLVLLRGSKYPQSKIGEVYKRVKSDLDKGVTVFFIGTPCQIAGLKAYLRKEYDLLYTMDFVCHGVASDKTWRDYVTYLKQKGDIENIVFKSKPHGWRKWYFRVIYKNENIYQIRGGMNLFMRSFLSYTNIRQSCYKCNFKGLNRYSDFTISDCWGIGEKNKKLNDDKGLSAILIHNDRASNIFEKIKENLNYERYDANVLMEGNWTTFKSVPANKIRSQFFENVMNKGTMYALKKYFSPSCIDWLKYYWHRIKGIEK